MDPLQTLTLYTGVVISLLSMENIPDYGMHCTFSIDGKKNTGNGWCVPDTDDCDYKNELTGRAQGKTCMWMCDVAMDNDIDKEVQDAVNQLFAQEYAKDN